MRPAPAVVAAGQEPAPPITLDERQAYVVAHRAGPLLVVGGPGTGKTHTLVEAIAAQVAAGEDPERLLVLTFGRRGATALRRRIEARITALSGRRVVREPLVRTFHAYAFGLLRTAASLRGEPAPRLLAGPEQDLVIRELLTDGAVAWPSELRPALRTRAFAEQLRDLLLRAAERGLDPRALARTGRAADRPDWVSAGAFAEEYEQVLALRDATTRNSIGYDNAELVRAAVAMLRADPELLDAERRRLRSVYVDELADTDPAQMELLELVAGGGAHVVAFADPDSSTFAFRGADPGLVGSFPDLFEMASGGPAPVLTLAANHRAAPELAAATARVGIRLRAPRRLGIAHRRAVSRAAEGGSTEVVALRSRASEAAYIAHRLREAHLEGGVPWSEMAVIMRSATNQLPSLQRGLRQAGVPTIVLAEDLPLHQQPAVRPFLLLLRCALRPGVLTEETAVALLHSPLGGADPLSERRLRQGLRALAHAADDHRPSGELLVEALRDPAEMVTIERRWAGPARQIAMLLATAKETAARPSATAEDVLWSVWRASGLADRWTAIATKPGFGPDQQRRSEAADRDLDAIVVLFDAAARFTDRLPGARIDTFLDHVEDQQLPADSLAPSADRGDAVRLLTAHAAKGQQWRVVVVAGVQEGVWPDLRLRGSLLGAETLVDVLARRAEGGGIEVAVAQSAALLDEERRLFHVAITRARRQLLVTAVDSGSVGGDAGDERPSRFLYELAGGEVTSADAVPIEAEELSVARPPRALTLAALVAELRMAVTSPKTSPARRRAAAIELARLAREGVEGAAPEQWWGLPDLSDGRALADEGDPITVTPSTIESALRCGLRWLLEKHGGSGPDSFAQGVGNLVHAAAMLADDASVDPATLMSYVNGRFDAIELAAAWLAPREKARAEAMVTKLVRWLVANPRRLVSIERDFLVRLAAAEENGQPIELKGRVDRLEIDDQGRLVIIDLKTGKSAPVEAEVPEHPQLGAYQVAVEAGAFEESITSGGAELVQLGVTKEPKVQGQEPLESSADPSWAEQMVRHTGATMAASTFVAKVNDKCRMCPVKSSCPVSRKGRQVIEP
ncbi:superfamily I DNA/RNA helicase/RecB family exonuclease [Allocatelliglobosispora scoriae]|uniref:DNA 3'-5' helicase n=1 Tax=Allocatelliglobosispora scoriae TaxID=643052 RepID=A0A841BY93_9ACTN|nr:ATP-dependent DNA helicase [Allocatelliglobosispora scoriae]MBB5871690.1 superfamily I DNA/RNA helicase/RecB family exonuclease [Allocatelliglobosispora scoriae]